MLKQIFVSLFLCISIQSYSQENIVAKKISIGILTSNWTYDYGAYITYHKEKNSYRLFFQDVNRSYGLFILSEWTIQRGSTRGFELGFNYNYYIRQDKIYIPYLQFGYMFRFDNSKDFLKPSQTYAYTWNFKDYYNTLVFGYGNSFKYKSIEVSITPTVHLFYVISNNYNFRYTYNEYPTNILDDFISKGFGLRLGIEASMGYTIKDVTYTKKITLN